MSRNCFCNAERASLRWANYFAGLVSTNGIGGAIGTVLRTTTGIVFDAIKIGFGDSLKWAETHGREKRCQCASTFVREVIAIGLVRGGR